MGRSGRRRWRRTPKDYGGRNETAAWGEEEFGRRAKGDAGKVAMAVRLRAETAVTVKWIAERLQMGAPGYVNHLLYLRRKAEGE